VVVVENITVRAKAWGNSVGIILPKELGVKPDDEVSVWISRNCKPAKVKDFFGVFAKSKLDTHKVLAELREEEW